MELRRVPEVIDVWFDSGCMPFAQHHAPFENEDRYEQARHADFICEALDQTRGWFYSLLAVSVLLDAPNDPEAWKFSEGELSTVSGSDGSASAAPYDNVMCLGLILDEDGQKMSKSKGNIVEPFSVIDEFGADALRWYFFSSKQPWDGYRFSPEQIGEGVRLFLKTLWNTYSFYALYAAAPADGEPATTDEAADGPAALTVASSAEPNLHAEDLADVLLDEWVRSRLSQTVADVTDALEGYDATNGARSLIAFVDDLSNWYVRRNRRRFWDADPAAFETLRTCLVTTAQLLAPYTPFIADELYDNLDGSEPSVHLTNWPEPGERDLPLEVAMATAREAVTLGLRARATAKVGLRRPLREAVIVATGSERQALEQLSEIVREELNVKQLRFVDDADELGSYALKPNYRALGPRFGNKMPQVAAAVAALDAGHAATTVRGGGTVGVNIDGHDHQLTLDDLLIGLDPIDGFQVEREAAHAVALDLAIDEELQREGIAREIVRAVQNARKDAGLDVSDRITLTLDGDEALLAAAREHEAMIAGEVLATAVEYRGDSAATTVTVEGAPLHIAVTRRS